MKEIAHRVANNYAMCKRHFVSWYFDHLYISVANHLEPRKSYVAAHLCTHREILSFPECRE